MMEFCGRIFQYSLNDIVIINNSIYNGEIGIVVGGWHRIYNEYHVKLINQDYKSITCKEYELELFNGCEDSNMANKKLAGYKAVAVIKLGGCDYHFAIYDDGNIYNPGDKIIVSGNSSLFTIDEIMSPEEASERFNKNITAEVICKIDTTSYDKRVEKRKEAEKLKKEMDKIIKEIDETKRCEMYTSESPELKEMYKKYRELIEN